MNPVRVLTDSTADLPRDLVERLGITVVPAYIQMEGESLRDGEQIDRSEFYRRLPALPHPPTTAVPPAHDFAAAFRSMVGHTAEAIAILVSASLSGMINAARLGSEEVPQIKVHWVDSGQLSMGLGWQVAVAAEAAAAGLGAREILAIVRDVQPRIRVLAVLDTLEYLRRSGRVAWARARAADLLHVKPIIELRHGEAVLVGHARTRRKAMERLHEITAGLGPLERLSALHTSASDLQSFCRRLGSLFAADSILTSHVGPAIGTHIGPNALGIAAVVAA